MDRTAARIAFAALISFAVYGQMFADPAVDTNAKVYASNLQDGTEIIGLLGMPLGELVSVKARIVATNSKETPSIIAIFAVNGRAVPQPIEMGYTIWQWGNLVGPLPYDEEIRLRVYETGGMVGVPVEAMKETTYVPSVAWGFRTSLILLYEERS